MYLSKVAMSHAGDAQASLVEECLAKHPAVLNLSSLRARLVSMIGADGAVAGGGPDRRHASTQAAQKLWCRIWSSDPTLPELIEWDKFHRLHTAFMRSMEQCTAAQEILAVGKAMSQQFGVGDGRVILRGVAKEMQEAASPAANVSGARKVFALSQTSQNLLRNFKNYTAALHLKVLRKRDGHGAASQSALTSLGRRLASLDFIAFLLLFEDMMQYRLRPFALVVQSSSEAAWSSQQAYQRMKKGFLQDIQDIKLVRRLIFIGTLLQHYCTKAELSRFWFCQLYTPLGKAFPSFFKHFYGLAVLHTFQDCKIPILTDLSVGTTCLTPRCQCAYQKGRTGPGLIKVSMRIGRRCRRILVPEYVAITHLSKEDLQTDMAAWSQDPLNVPPSGLATSIHIAAVMVYFL